jgi:hypothetical protein
VDKPLKNIVADKGRNRTSTAKRAAVLLLCLLNLRLLHQKESLRSAVKAALGKVVDPDDPLVYE